MNHLYGKDVDIFFASISEALRKKIQELAKEELEKVFKTLKEKTEHQIDALALQLLKHYNAEFNHDVLVIRVQKPPEQKT